MLFRDRDDPSLVCLFVFVSDGLIGMAIVGGAAAIAVGGIVGLGIALSKK